MFMKKNMKNLPLWARSAVMGGLFGLVFTFMEVARGFANPLVGFAALLAIAGSSIYFIR